MLIEYPTPQLAAEHLRRIDAVRQAAPPQLGVAALENGSPFFDKRTGPIIAVAAGPLSESEANALLGLVNYEANVNGTRTPISTRTTTSVHCWSTSSSYALYSAPSRSSRALVLVAFAFW